MDTKERIVAAASRLFYMQGYNNTGINQVIKEADVAKASLYQHFASKEDLLVEYLRISADETNKMLWSAAEKQQTPKKKVLSVFDSLLRQIQQSEYNGCNFLNIASEIPKTNKSVRELIKRQKNQIRNMFAEILKPDNKEHLADELYVLLDAALITSKVYNDVWPVKAVRKIVAKLI